MCQALHSEGGRDWRGASPGQRDAQAIAAEQGSCVLVRAPLSSLRRHPCCARRWVGACEGRPLGARRRTAKQKMRSHSALCIAARTPGRLISLMSSRPSFVAGCTAAFGLARPVQCLVHRTFQSTRTFHSAPLAAVTPRDASIPNCASKARAKPALTNFNSKIQLRRNTGPK